MPRFLCTIKMENLIILHIIKMETDLCREWRT